MRSMLFCAFLAFPFQMRQCNRSVSATITAFAAIRAGFRGVATHGLLVLSGADREQLLQNIRGRSVAHQGREMGPKLIQLRCRSAMRWPADANLDGATRGTAKWGKSDRDLAEKRGYRVISVVLHGTVQRLGVWGRERYDGLCLFDRGIVHGLDFATGRNRPRHHGRWCRPDRDRSTHRPCRDRQSGADAVGGETGSGAYAASVGCRAGSRSCGSAPRLLILQWNMPYQGLATASDRDSVRWSDGAAPAMALYWLSRD